MSRAWLAVTPKTGMTVFGSMEGGFTIQIAIVGRIRDLAGNERSLCEVFE